MFAIIYTRMIYLPYGIIVYFARLLFCDITFDDAYLQQKEKVNV